MHPSSASFLSLRCMYFFSVAVNHKMLAVLCSLWPGWGVCRRLAWRHPLCAQRQRWMRSGFGLCRCGWVIGHRERPRVKILRWECFYLCSGAIHSPLVVVVLLLLLLCRTPTIIHSVYHLIPRLHFLSLSPLINPDTLLQPPWLSLLLHLSFYFLLFFTVVTEKCCYFNSFSVILISPVTL